MKKIRTKLLLGIMPPVLIAMIALTVVSALRAGTIIQDETDSWMESELNYQKAKVESTLGDIGTTANTLAAMMSLHYTTLDKAAIERSIATVAGSNDMVLGSGVWFEPYVYDPNEKYFGPYAYKEADQINITYDYSNASYDYFNQEYYMMCNGAQGAKFTAPYFDETLGVMMSSCASPIYIDNKFAGCVTVTLKLDSLQEFISGIQIGEHGNATLITGDGIYVGSADADKVATAASIAGTPIGDEVLNNEQGIFHVLEDGATNNIYYSTIAGLGWKVFIRVPQSQISAPINRLILIMIVICVVAIIVCALFILSLVNHMATRIKHLHTFSETLAEGDFTVPEVRITSYDELGQMGVAMNRMYLANRDVISNIASHSVEIDDSSTSLNESMNTLISSFELIHDLISSINEDMMTSSAATEEVNASTEEVVSAVNVLTEESQKSIRIVSEIKQRASKVEVDSNESHHHALELASTFEKNLQSCLKNAEVVGQVSIMADAISGIASQINLLSLNASIEAARAGEQGRGFAVVATEIGKLATETADTVNQIQGTISDVQMAVEDLIKESNGLVTFLKETVTPDYNHFVDIAKQYGTDATNIEDFTSRITDMSERIESIMRDVSTAMINIAESTQNTATASSQMLDNVNEVNEVVQEVSSLSEQNGAIASNLQQVVQRFKLES